MNSIFAREKHQIFLELFFVYSRQKVSFLREDCYNLLSCKNLRPERKHAMNVIICDDDIQYLEKLKSYVDKWRSNNHREETKVQIFHSSEDLVAQWEKGLQADVAFLDVLFDYEMNGLNLAHVIRQRDVLH